MNYNKIGAFGTRPQSAGLRPNGNVIKKPAQKVNHFARKNSQTELKKPVGPEWNSNLQENPHKLS